MCCFNGLGDTGPLERSEVRERERERDQPPQPQWREGCTNSHGTESWYYVGGQAEQEHHHLINFSTCRRSFFLYDWIRMICTDFIILKKGRI